MAKSQLSRVVRGRIDAPERVFVYSLEGTGKTTFAAGAPEPIFLGAESGTEQLDIARLPEPKTFDDAMQAVQELIQHPHDFKTFVIDTVDWLEPLVFGHVMKNHGGSTIEKAAGGYGKGFNIAIDYWRQLLVKLDELRHTRKVGVILLGHAQIKNFKNPEGQDYDTYRPKVHEKAVALLSEWTDVLMYASIDVQVAEKGTEDAKKHYALSRGTRTLYTERRAAFAAKNRHGLPFKLPLSYAAYAEAVASRSPSAMRLVIAELREKIRKLEKVFPPKENGVLQDPNVYRSGEDVYALMGQLTKDAGDDAEALGAIIARANEVLEENES